MLVRSRWRAQPPAVPTRSLRSPTTAGTGRGVK